MISALENIRVFFPLVNEALFGLGSGLLATLSLGISNRLKADLFCKVMSNMEQESRIKDKILGPNKQYSEKLLHMIGKASTFFGVVLPAIFIIATAYTLNNNHFVFSMSGDHLFFVAISASIFIFLSESLLNKECILLIKEMVPNSDEIKIKRSLKRLFWNILTISSVLYFSRSLAVSAGVLAYSATIYLEFVRRNFFDRVQNTVVSNG